MLNGAAHASRIRHGGDLARRYRDWRAVQGRRRARRGEEGDGQAARHVRREGRELRREWREDLPLELVRVFLLPSFFPSSPTTPLDVTPRRRIRVSRWLWCSF